MEIQPARSVVKSLRDLFMKFGDDSKYSDEQLLDFINRLTIFKESRDNSSIEDILSNIADEDEFLTEAFVVIEINPGKEKEPESDPDEGKGSE